VRSPYGPTSRSMALMHVLLNGFAGVMQDQRGTEASAGTFDMWQRDGQDGLETMRWIKEQPWSNGNVYTVGMSADGISTETPQKYENLPVKGQWSIYTAADAHKFTYPGGVYRIGVFEGYMDFMGKLTRGASAKRVIPEGKKHEAFGPWWKNLTACRNESSLGMPCWYNNVHWPVIESAGWWDIFQDGQLQSFAGLRAGSDPSIRDKHVLIVDPLGHCAAALTHRGTGHLTTAKLVAESGMPYPSLPKWLQNSLMAYLMAL